MTAETAANRSPPPTGASVEAPAPPASASPRGSERSPVERDWTGAYQYEECGGPSSLTPGGPAACWQYIIEIARSAAADKQWRAYLAVDGYMTSERVAARGEEEGAILKLRFDPLSGQSEETAGTHAPGEHLLTIARRGGETWVRFEAMRSDSGRREAKLERLRAPPPSPKKSMNQDPEGLVCKTDVDCILHRCNTKRGRCAYPCESDADCLAGMRCGAPACIPVERKHTP